ncbi:uncharacterized protein [Choristoneura fumiferana]|uniref:uncharacterized protein n=1 Tax=Choristoneura fumiferana TaxID=7141 RepID=UPI003D1584BD
MRATAVLLLVAVVGSTVQAVRIRGSRRKFIVDKPIVNLTPAQKEYFVRLLWLMKNLKNGSDPNLRPNNPELMQKLAQGGFYYDDGLNEKSENGSSTKHSDYYYHGSQSYNIQNNSESGHTSSVRSKGDENSVKNGNHGESQNDNNNEIGDKISFNENVTPNPSPLEIQEHIETLKNNDSLGPYIIDGNKSSSRSKSNEIESPHSVENNIRSPHVVQAHESNDSLRTDEIQGPYVVHGGAYDSFSRENAVKNHENDDTYISNGLPFPYKTGKPYDKYNSYFKENEQKYAVNNDLHRNNEFQDSYFIRSDEYNSYPIENEFNNYVNNNAFRSNEILNSGEHKSYSRENNIKSSENNDNNRESDLQSESREIQWAYGSQSEEDSNYLTDDFPEGLLRSDEYNDLPNSLMQRSDEQISLEERGPSYNELDLNVQEPQNGPDSHSTLYDNDNQSNKIRASIEDLLNENNIYQHRYKQKSKYKHRHEYRQRHRQKLKVSSHLPRFIVQPDLSLETIRIIPAPRLTSLVIKMCDISEPNILEVWKKVAKRLNLDSDYTISNIYEVEQLFKIIRTFVTLSKKENFLRMPLNKILVTIRDSIRNERDSRSVEAYKYEDYDDGYNSEESYYSENGLRDPLDSTNFYVDASLEPIEIPSDSLTTFLEYIFETQEDSFADSGHDDNSNSLISDESEAEKLQEFINKYKSAELFPNLSSSDNDSNDTHTSNDLDIDLEDFRDFDDAASKIRNQTEELNQSNLSGDLDSDDSIDDVLPILSDIRSSRSSEELPLIISEDNSYINSSNQSIPEDDILDRVIPSLEVSNEEITPDSLNSDDENGDNGPYSPNSDSSSKSSNVNDSNEHSMLPYTESSTKHESESEDNLNVDISLDISSPSSYPVSSKESISFHTKETSSREDPDVSNDHLNNLIPYVTETEVNTFILPFLEKYSQCRGPIHDEISQKVREVIELLQNAKCF